MPAAVSARRGSLFAGVLKGAGALSTPLGMQLPGQDCGECQPAERQNAGADEGRFRGSPRSMTWRRQQAAAQNQCAGRAIPRQFSFHTPQWASVARMLRAAGNQNKAWQGFPEAAFDMHQGVRFRHFTQFACCGHVAPSLGAARVVLVCTRRRQCIGISDCRY